MPYAGLGLAFARGWVAAIEGDATVFEAARADFREARRKQRRPRRGYGLPRPS